MKQMTWLGWKKSRVGFTLIELAIVLSIIGTVAAGLWRLSANSNQQTKDQATAQQQLALITAIKGFLNDNSGANSGQTWLSGFAIHTAHNLPLPASCAAPVGIYKVMCSYLPPGFTNATTNPYGQTYVVQVMTGSVSPGQNYSIMIATSIAAVGSPIPDSDGGRISSLIGSDGGFLYSSNICGAAMSTTACGTMNAWVIATTTYGFAVPTTSGTVVSLSYPTSSATINPEWLARTVLPGDPSLYYSNTMATDIFMGPPVMPFAGPAAGADTAPFVGPPSVPSIHLHNGYIEGSGIDGSTGNFAQIFLSQTAANSDAFEKPLIQLSTGCLSAADILCPPGMQVYGDIDASGYITAGKIFSASDARLKMNVHPIKDPLDELMKIQPVTYNFKDSRSAGMGVIAQDLEKIYPQLVSTTHGTKYVDYNGLIGPLIGAVQELKKENDVLREQLHQQSDREQKLEQKLNTPN